MKRFLAVIPVLVGLLAVGAAAQSINTAELHVIVKDPSGSMVTKARVTVRDESRGIERTLADRPQGEYQFLSLPPGVYTVTVDAGGFARAMAVGVRVTVGQAAELPLTLRMAGAATEVTVSGETELVETQRTSVATTINQQRIDNLPINGRNYINFTLLNSQTARDNAPSIGAAPTSGLNIGGQRARANLVNVDGVDADDDSVNGVRSTVSQEAVQEFQLITNGYAAEYGRASGGVVNIITRSGTNDFHGNAFGYLRNRDFQAVNPFSTTPNPAYTRVQAGATGGGALKKDKTFYFFSYETTRRQETGFSTVGHNNFGLTSVNVNSYVDALVGFPGFCAATFGGCFVNATAQQAAFFSSPPPVPPSVIGQYALVVGAGSGTALNEAMPVWVTAVAGAPNP
ncbi:MAG TPA: carboxypeptidase regulatory-like domain-containing protein, partial [Terriglobales bacterium]|nr:carboxypeptidase regulatory-like domain-containing protein [Terriglobales bacterium]